MNPKLLLHHISYLALPMALLISACTRTPSPEPFLMPVFEQVSIDESAPGEVTVSCRMSSMRQVTECGATVSTSEGQPEEEWETVSGSIKGNDTFTVTLHDLRPGATYAYRLFIGNGRTRTSSARNYYTVSE